ncbi:flagellar hook-length control protein FliK [Marivibrio halodurans]
MSVTGLDNRQEVLSAATAATKASKADPKEENAVAASGAPDFAALLQGRLGRNMALSRAESQLSVPQRADASQDAGALTDQRPRDAGFDSTARDDVRDSAARDSARHDGRQAEARPRADRPAHDAPQARADQPARTADDGVSTQGAQGSQNTPANTKATPAGSGDATAASPKSEARPAAPAKADSTGQAAQAQASAGKAADTVAPRQAGQSTADLPGRVQVTQAQTQPGGAPQGTLDAASAIAAQSARANGKGAAANPAGNGSTLANANPDEAQNILTGLRAQGRDGAVASGGGEANANGKGTSNAAPSAQAAKAKAEAKLAANQNTGAKAPEQPAAQAAPGLGAQQAQPKSGSFGTQLAAESGARMGATTGSGKPAVATDAMTGTTSLTGQNNSVQQRSAPPPTAQTARNTPPPPIADQLAVQIHKAAGTGSDRIQIQLRPADLGRVEIKMEVSHDGRMTAVISADKPETLDMLRQDQRQLLQTLNDAGLKADQQSLSFNLRGQQQDGDGRGNGPMQAGNEFDDAGESDLPARDPFDDLGESGGYSADGRLNMRV